ncbi:hypothetical protein FACS1894169_11150 [Bacteroidia bacterium]|nr:hypothetical protein FACS1894169_11150 [Bacteroidia bacterium]
MNKQYKHRKSPALKVIKKRNRWRCSCSLSNGRVCSSKTFDTKSLSKYAEAIEYLQQIEEKEIDIMILSSIKVREAVKKTL